MRTISEKLKLYKSVLSGKTFTRPNGDTFSSDGVYWIVNGFPVCPLDKQKRVLDIIVEKCELMKNILNILGEETVLMYDEYYIVFDSLDGMTLLINNSDSQIKFVYTVSSKVEVKVIDKASSYMVYHYFEVDPNEIKHSVMDGFLSLKAKRMLDDIRGDNIDIDQNFYYEMLLEGIITPMDLKTACIKKSSSIIAGKFKN